MPDPSLPFAERILLGPGPSTISPRVMRAMAAPVLSHLDQDVLALLDSVRTKLTALFRAPEGTLTLAVSGTGTAGLEATVANLVHERTRVLALVNGYFGERLAEVCRRYGADVRRLEAEWGRAVDPQAVRDALRDSAADIVTCVHAETSTGVLNPVREIAAAAREADALILVDAVTSLGGHPVEVDAWGIDAVYSCTQKCVGAPSGLAPVAFTPRAQSRRTPSRSFYLDLALLEDYWVRRKYHHTLSSTLIYALHEALVAIQEEGLEDRWARHEGHHVALVRGLEAMGLSLLAPRGERLWTLNAVRVPAGLDEAAARRGLLNGFGIEIGAGLGPLAGAIWRVGFMGASSTRSYVALFLGALEHVVTSLGHRCTPGAGVAAAMAALDAR